jgi:mannose-6-phosphate isomerase-like protein (cupin superfamily)
VTDNRARKPVKIVPKGWGREVWIANNDLYCGKILEIRKGQRCSLHFDKLKTESFYLRVGRLKVRVKESPESETIEEFELSAGECMDVPRGLVHQMEARGAVRVLDAALRQRLASHRTGRLRCTGVLWINVEGCADYRGNRAGSLVPRRFLIKKG